MPSLQISFKDGSTPDLAATRSLTGPDILQKHSINSLLERNEMINRGLSSPIEGETLAFSDILGANTSTSPTTKSGQTFMNSLTNSSNGGSTNSSGYYSSSLNGTSGGGANQSPSTTTMTPNIYQLQSAKSFDDFQFDNTIIGSNGNNNSNNNNNRNGSSMTSTPLKMLQRNFSFEGSSTPTTPSTPSSLCPQNPLRTTMRSTSQYSSDSTNSLIGSTGMEHHSSSIFNSSSIGSRSNSPNENEQGFMANLENSNLLDVMNFLSLNQSSNVHNNNYQQQQHQSSYNSPTSIPDLELTRLQNLHTLNALRILQQSQQLQQLQQSTPFNNLNNINQLNQILQYYSPNQIKSWQIQQTQATSSDANLDRVARFHRSSAALYDATCTWSGVLPPRSHRLITYSPKVFLGGIPWDISEQSLVQIFRQFGPIRVEWPGKEQHASQPKGYAYIIFESEKQVKALLQSCTIPDYCSSNQSIPTSVVFGTNGIYYFKISSKRIKAKEVEVIPWVIADSNYVKLPSQKLDPTKTVFVGALHGKLTAEGLAQIMNDLFDGVVYAGIDTDKYKYPIGSGRVTFNNSRSYMKAVSAAFIEIKTTKFTKKVQVDPYLEDSLCSMCGVQHGPYYCRELVCFRYFCRTCWQFQHNNDRSLRNHKPLTRNSKSTTIVGVGPQQSAASTPTSPTEPAQQHPMLSAAFNKQFQQQQYQQSNVV